MKTVEIPEATTHFPTLLKEVSETGETIVICNNGKPVADLTPHKRSDRLSTHPALSKIRLHYNPSEPLSEDEWPENAR